MLNSVVIVDTAVVTAFGDGLDCLWQGLLAGRTAIGPVNRFSTERYITEQAAVIRDLRASAGHSRLLPLVDRTLDQLAEVPADAVLLGATTKAGIDNLEAACRGRETTAREVLATAFLDHVQKRLGLHGPAMNINAACASSTIAVARGAAMIACGAAEAVLVCCADLVTEFVFSGFSALQALSPAPCRPFDRNRNGLTLGEGAAAILLLNRARAVREGWRIGSVISGWGVANDANHVTAPARDGCGLILATRKALSTAGLQPEPIAGIVGHGTATVYNDLMELTAFKAVFGEARRPLTSIKGAVGHTLGAAGGIEIVVSQRSLDEGQLPPTVGLMDPEEGAANCVSAAPMALSGNHVLSTNSGFGGINAAIVLSRGGAA